EIVRALADNPLLADRRVLAVVFEELFGVSPEPGKSGKGRKGMSHDDLLHWIARCPRFGLKVDQSGFRDSAESVDFGLSADTASPDSAVSPVYPVQSFFPVLQTSFSIGLSRARRMLTIRTV